MIQEFQLGGGEEELLQDVDIERVRGESRGHAEDDKVMCPARRHGVCLQPVWHI